MATRELTLTVDTGRVHARLDDGAESDAGYFGTDAIDTELVRSFARWLVDPLRAWEKRDIAAFGALLYRMLLGSERVERFVMREIDGLDDGDVLRLQLSFQGTSAPLASLPWEYLYCPEADTRSGFFLATDERLILSRFTPLQRGRRTLQVPTPPLRMMVIVSQPDDPTLGEVVSEPVLDAVKREVASLPVEMTLVDAPTSENLRSALKATQPHMIHFMGHGEYHEEKQVGRIALLDRDGGTWWCTEDQVVDILSRAKARPHLMVLHACEGAKLDERARFAGMAPQLVRHGVQAVVAMQYAVTNQTAIRFSNKFYGELFAGRPVDEAVQEARWDIRGVGGDEDDARLLGVPVLYLHSSDAVVLPRPTTGSPS